ncbi:hypothetical protein AXF42_Ash008656 [Apostasia shenzhenica]|uniref:Uncharacterized protein n=1 Tax=Apostasia shenzhenica TaxID=1088818 RepID=A0A2I0B220_9ASPA|nr:hypothetical protein AXF42_Ash008656 [Apostasia shenzhenica]
MQQKPEGKKETEYSFRDGRFSCWKRTGHVPFTAAAGWRLAGVLAGSTPARSWTGFCFPALPEVNSLNLGRRFN